MPLSGAGEGETPEAVDAQAVAGFDPCLKSTSKLHLTTALTTDSRISRNEKTKYPGVAKLVSRLVWEQEARVRVSTHGKPEKP